MVKVVKKRRVRALNVEISLDLDDRIRLHVARMRTTKKKFVTAAIEEKLVRDRDLMPESDEEEDETG
jgi:hypothetical protein